MTLGEQIKKRREMENLSQEELAERLGVSRQAVSKWEGDLSIPTGSNKRLLCELLSLDLPEAAQAPKYLKKMCIAGWGFTAALLMILALGWFGTGKQAVASPPPLEPALNSVRFYDEQQNEVLPEALWYNFAGINSILLQWSGGTPKTVKMFFTPAGSETVEETELMEVKTPMDGETALLLSAGPLHREDLSGHLYFELDFGGGEVVVTDSLYNGFFDPVLLAQNA